MVPEALSAVGTAVQHHGLGALGGAGGYHMVRTIMPWLKENGTIKGVWKNYIWAPKAVVKETVTTQTEIQPKP